MWAAWCCTPSSRRSGRSGYGARGDDSRAVLGTAHVHTVDAICPCWRSTGISVLQKAAAAAASKPRSAHSNSKCGCSSNRLSRSPLAVLSIPLPQWTHTRQHSIRATSRVTTAPTPSPRTLHTLAAAYAAAACYCSAARPPTRGLYPRIGQHPLRLSLSTGTTSRWLPALLVLRMRRRHPRSLPPAPSRTHE